MRQWRDRTFRGHLNIGPVTIYGANAMHWAVNIRVGKFGYLCFRLPLKCFGQRWGWYLYLSRNGTPWQAVVAYGSGVSRDDKRHARLRRLLVGWSFAAEEPLANPEALDEVVAAWQRAGIHGL